MEAFLTSAGIVAIAEIGDRTQLLAMLLASQFRRPVPIILGILAATLANHALAGLAGEWVGSLLTPTILRWVLGVSFLAMAAWTLVPDTIEAGAAGAGPRRGVLLTTLVGFFLCEIGDKTQFATAALAARFNALLVVVVGTTAGMMLANIPAVLLGHYAGDRIGLKGARYVAAAIFAAEAVLTLVGYGTL